MKREVPNDDLLAAAIAPLEHTRRGPLVLLFYDGYEKQAREGLAGRLRSAVRGAARAAWRRLRGKQVNTGFYVAFLGLRDALLSVGCDVRVNDFAAARRRPAYPIGIAGYPQVLDRVRLRNPTIFGPGDPGFPEKAAEVAKRPEIRRIIQPCDWYVEFYRPYCGDKMMCWPVGIDVDAIPDASGDEKRIDVVVYDKIRWRRDALVPALRDRLLRHLASRGLTVKVLRYGDHVQADYFAALHQGRSLAFLCEHETQGLACQEAMAMNVPVFAWEEGRLADPKQQRYVAPDFAVSSVPYFDDRCGTRFTIETVEAAFDQFWRKLPDFAPRDYVREALSVRGSAVSYLSVYGAIARRPA